MTHSCIRPLSRALVSVAAGATAVIVFAGCKMKNPPPITAPWHDNFNRTQLGSDYHPTSSVYKIVNGALSAHGAHNHPLWLRKKLPRNVSIEFDTWSNTSDGDIKVEFFGDGESHESQHAIRRDLAYTASGYDAIMGGWHNTESIICKGNEHGEKRIKRTEPKVIIGHHYHWKIVRKGARIDWYVDDMKTPFLSYVDPHPIYDSDHCYFGFSDWESDSWFDNLTITPL